MCARELKGGQRSPAWERGAPASTGSPVNGWKRFGSICEYFTVTKNHDYGDRRELETAAPLRENRAKQSRAEQSRAEQSRAEQSRALGAGQIRAGTTRRHRSGGGRISCGRVLKVVEMLRVGWRLRRKKSSSPGKKFPAGGKTPRRWSNLASLLVFNRGTEEKVRQATASCHLFDIAGPLAADPHL